MYAYQVWLNNLIVVTLLTINSFPYKLVYMLSMNLYVTIQRSYAALFP